MYFSHEYLWNKDADQPVEKNVHMSTVIGTSRLGTIFTNYMVYWSSVAPAVARSPSLSTILIFISHMWVWVWVYVRWELLFAVVGLRFASVPMILLSLSLSLSRSTHSIVFRLQCDGLHSERGLNELNLVFVLFYFYLYLSLCTYFDFWWLGFNVWAPFYISYYKALKKFKYFAAGFTGHCAQNA